MELAKGTIILQEANATLKREMKGGRILVQRVASDYLSQEMSGGGIIAAGCRGLCLSKHAQRLWGDAGLCRQIRGLGQLRRSDFSRKRH